MEGNDNDNFMEENDNVTFVDNTENDNVAFVDNTSYALHAPFLTLITLSLLTLVQ